MDKYQGKYRIPSTRATFWDYGSNAPYFVTICTKNREYSFGDVINGEMVLSEIGKIADECWLAIPDHFPFVKLHNHIIMPNHVHGIIVIDKDISESANIAVAETQNAETQNLASQPKSANSDSPQNRFGPQSKNLASIVRGFKIGVTKGGRLIDPNFAWQPRYHDIIIRDDRAFQNIANYIADNPARWGKDKFKIE